MNYNWNARYIRKRFRDVHANTVDEVGVIDPRELTLDEMKSLGFLAWEEGNPMMLIPLWLYQFMPPDMEVETIRGEKERMSAMDSEHRYGMLACGVVPKAV